MLSSILGTKERVNIANKIRVDWSSSTSNTYVGIGRVAAWSVGDTSIPIVNNSITTVNSIFDNLFAVKKITDSDMALVVPRYDWQYNTVYYNYTDYDDMTTNIDIDPMTNGSITVSSSNTNVYGTNTTFTLDFNVGDSIQYLNTADNTVDRREVINIISPTHIVVNSVFSVTLTTSYYYGYYDFTPRYAHPYYVRNTYDQVFKCLSNNYNWSTSTETPSTYMPEIGLGGNLPTNPFIITDDGYKWKYMYTIPAGLKRKFFTADWMPVVNELQVTSSSVDGRIDIVDIINSGSGYNSNVPGANVTIVSVSGNGTGANLSAVVDSSGAITGINVLDGGSGYTYANVIINDIVGSSGNGAILTPIISPHGGNGANAEYELGATTFMLCTEIDGDEGGLIPVSTPSGNPFDYHQVSIIKNPALSSNSFVTASNSVYDMTLVVNMTPFTSNLFDTNDIAYQGVSYSSAYFTATIVNSDSVSRKVYLNNIRGSFDPTDALKTVNSKASIPPVGITVSDVKTYTGDVLYVENRPMVTRSSDQTEQIKLIIQV